MGFLSNLFSKKKDGDGGEEEKPSTSTRKGSLPGGKRGSLPKIERPGGARLSPSRPPTGASAPVSAPNPPATAPAKPGIKPIAPKAQAKAQPEPAPEEMDIDLSGIEEIEEESAQDNSRSGNSTTILPAKRPTAAASAPSPAPSATPSKTDSTAGHRKLVSTIVKRMIGNLLVSAQSVSEAQLNRALVTQEEKGGLIGQILVEMGACTAAQIGNALNKQRTITSVMLPKVKFDAEALAAVPKETCEKFRLVPFQKIGSLLCVAMANVLDNQAKEELRNSTQMKIKPFDAAYKDIIDAIEKRYAADGRPAAQDTAASQAVAAEDESVVEISEDDLEDIVIEIPDEEAGTQAKEAQPKPAAQPQPKPAEHKPAAPARPMPAPAAAQAKPALPTPVAPRPMIMPKPAPAMAKAPAAGPLQAIPVAEMYFASAVRNGRYSPAARWEFDLSGNAPLPAKPEHS